MAVVLHKNSRFVTRYILLGEIWPIIEEIDERQMMLGSFRA
jgi:hypothetical protein